MPALRPARQIRLAALWASDRSLGRVYLKMDWIMPDLAFIALGAALFLGALLYARGCAGI
jgi:hypothetical protein